LARKVKFAFAFEVRRRMKRLIFDGEAPKIGIDVPVG
jgi:hypothetical protein